jgi:hypothetical protein
MEAGAPAVRASDAERERTALQLRDAAADGAAMGGINVRSAKPRRRVDVVTPAAPLPPARPQ